MTPRSLICAACFVTLLGCGRPTPAAQPVVSTAPVVTTAPSRAPAPTPPNPFVFHHGGARERLGAYALRYWGPGGANVFSSAATSRPADVAQATGDEVLLEVGQYAVVEVPGESGLWVRDLGERGWVTRIEARDLSGGVKKDVVLRYTLRDPDDDPAVRRDARTWHAKLPDVTAATHMVIEVWSFSTTPPARLFVHEHASWALCCGSEIGPAPPRVEDEIILKPGEITLRAREAVRAGPSSWHVAALPHVPPLLLPWDDVTSRTFRFDGQQFVLVEER